MKTNTRKRESNYELLRIISIYLIALFHSAWHGGIQAGGVTGNIMIDIIDQFGELGVNCFILISGYYSKYSKFKKLKLADLIIQVNFYMVLCAAIVRIVWRGSFWEIVRSQIFPVTLNRCWFITAYILLYLISPFLRMFIKSLDKKNFERFLLVVSVVWVLIPSAFGIKYGIENMLYYNRFEWFVILYFIGAYLREYGDSIFKSLKRTIVILAVLSFVSFSFIVMVNVTELNALLDGAYFWPPNSILQISISITFFYMFRYIKISYSRIINYIASCTLGIYLLHDWILSGYIWNNIFRFNQDIAALSLLPKMLIAAFSICVFGLVTESCWKVIKKVFDLCVYTCRSKFNRNK